MDDFIFGTLSTEALRISRLHVLHGGVTHHSRRLPRDPLPGQPVRLELSLGPSQPFDSAWVYWSNDGQDPQGAHGVASQGYAIPMEPVDTDWDLLEWGYIRRFHVVLPGQPAGTVVRYRLSASSKGGKEVFADQGAYYAYYVADDPTPDWAYDAVVYQIMVDRFWPGQGKEWMQPEFPSGFYGGNLRGLIEKIDYLAELGVNVLWLTPIFPSPSHHGYDATDFFDIEPRLGTKDDFQEFLKKAHDRGLRVLLDFVPNHWSNLHPSFQQAITDKTSPHADWYTFNKWPEKYESFFGVPDLPQINLRNASARQHVLDAAVHWLDFGVDGFRLDYAIGPTPDFWADFRRATRTARPDCWTFGEVVEPPDSQRAFQGLLDGCLDFMLLEALRQTFAFGRWDAARFASFLDRHEAFFPPDFSRPSFLDNHDMNRYLWAVQGNLRRLKIAALCQFTLSGPPVIYYGTEIGLSQERDVRQGSFGLPEEARLPMLWDQDQNSELLAFYHNLVQLRRHEACLRRGQRHTVLSDSGCLVYIRQHEGEQILIAINLSAEYNSQVIEGNWNTILLATDPGCELQSGPESALIKLQPLSGLILK